MPPPHIIEDNTPDDILFPTTHARGLVPRDYSIYPQEMFAPPSEIPLIPRSEWDARIDEQESQKASLEHIRLTANDGKPIPSYDQNGQGFCWAYSNTGGVTLVRARDGAPYVRLSAHGVACKVMNFQDKGAWCGLSAQFIREHGIPTAHDWPEKSMSRTFDTELTWKNAAGFKITQDYVDLTRPVWGQNLTFDQVATCLLLNIPCAVDFNWWGHSVCALRLVRVEAGSYGIKIWNSWTDQWGELGMSVLRGSRSIPDGAVATRAVIAA